MFESVITCFYLFAAVTIDLEFNQTQINLYSKPVLVNWCQWVTPVFQPSKRNVA